MAKIADRYFMVDPWMIIEEGFVPSHGRVAESVFSLANEFMGVRGYFEEGYSGDRLLGSYINGVYADDVERPYCYKGLVDRVDFVVNNVDWLYTRIFVDGEQLDLAQCKFHGFKRVLDMKNGTLSREFIWETSGGKLLKVSFLRFTSMDIPYLGCQRITFEPVNTSGIASVRSCLDFSTLHEETHKNYWTCTRNQANGGIVACLALTGNSGQQVFSAFRLSLSPSIKTKHIEDEKLIGMEFSIPLSEGKAFSIDKMVVNYAEKKRGVNPDEVWNKGFELAEKYFKLSFDEAMKGHGRYWTDVWNTLDITIEGDPENQQGIRFCVFNLHQTYHGADDTLNVGAKGLTGESYGGRTWWDTETYCLPFYLFNNPVAARNLVEYRYHHLPKALERAKEMDCTGACYPMSTIDGRECCNWWVHGNLEIHVSAAIPYGIWHYTHLYQDKKFLSTHGIEILLQSCRYFASRGQWSQLTGEFGLYGVMGPDEFHMMVHNNCYTNVMVKKIFEFTLQVVDDMKRNASSQLQAVFAKVGLARSELDDWRKMAKEMRIPYDKKTGRYEQHDGFFDLPHIDVRAIPPTQFPLYHHWAYDRIFRYDMIKQPDVLLLLFFFSQEYSLETKRANYEYYEPRCSHESSLSPAIHSILAAELGKHEEAYNFAHYAGRLDLDDYNHNTREGLHITSMAGAWLNIVYGYGGMRSDGEKLVFNPSLPKNWTSFSFTILYRGTRLNITVDRTTVTLNVHAGPAVAVKLFGKEYVVDSHGISLGMPAERLG
ncbi:MAG: glycosyl hydrolase family 65 protein [Spirochaetia bacterium]|jgi:maltose phosphorylase